jgi:putative SOS response-associated peptidase YedK
VPLDGFLRMEEDRFWQAALRDHVEGSAADKHGGLRTWRSPTGERIRSFTIMTTQPNESCAQLHNRMPAVLKPEAWPSWLGEKPIDVPLLKALLAPLPKI